MGRTWAGPWGRQPEGHTEWVFTEENGACLIEQVGTNPRLRRVPARLSICPFPESMRQTCLALAWLSLAPGPQERRCLWVPEPTT